VRRRTGGIRAKGGNADVADEEDAIVDAERDAEQGRRGEGRRTDDGTDDDDDDDDGRRWGRWIDGYGTWETREFRTEVERGAWERWEG